MPCGSAAAKQQLIELHKEKIEYFNFGSLRVPIRKIDESLLNARTVSQGFSTNSGSTFFQNFYNNQFDNGLPNSKGYPMNLRKISLVNGSLTGKKDATDSQLTMNIRGFADICFFLCGKAHVASMEVYSMPSFSKTSKIARFKKGQTDSSVAATNLNSRGNMDIVPGGYFDSYNQLHNSIMDQSGPRTTFMSGLYIDLRAEDITLESRTNTKIHSFIPTFSALGIKNPDQDWGRSLNTNLVCSGETPFDSYYGEVDNTEHTSFNENSVSWLFKELGDSTTPPIAQSPNFPIQQSLPVGASSICINSDTTYNLDTCMVPSEATWSTTSGLQIISSTGYNVTVRGLVAGYVSLIATFQNGQKLTRSIQVSGSAVETNPGRVVGNPTINLNETSAFNYEGGANGVTNYSWFIYGGINDGQGPDGAAYITRGQGTTFIELENGSIAGTLVIEVKALNACDEVIDSAFMFVEVTNPMARFAATSSSSTISTFPNPLPASNELQVNVVQKTTTTTTVATATKATAIATDNQVKIYDFYGNLKYSSRFKTDNMSLKNLNLKEGNYILNVNTNAGEQLRTILFVK